MLMNERRWNMSIEVQVEQLLFEAIDDVNETLPEAQRIERVKSSPLFGEGGGLDSLSLVNLIVATEQKVQEALDCSITLADEKAMSQKNSPFRTVESLAAYIIMLLKENNN
ncbi:MAG: long-chain fatty acid--CoA ligase [Deltaproteobacteria bacterium]|nr:long-chain fatty acid--CoA ligase [Deltaproteobacteria bacterium]